MSRANEDIKVDLPFLSIENDSEIELPSELESLIMEYIHHNRTRLSKKMRKLLNHPVISNGKTWASPESMWILTLYREWAEERLIWLSAQHINRPEQAVYLLRNYGAPVYGWLAWKVERNKEPLKSPMFASVNPIEKISYGD